MSRIASKPIAIPQGVDVNLIKNSILVRGPKGSLERTIHDFVSVVIEDGNILVSKAENVKCRKDQEKFSRAMPGTTRSLLASMVEGVSQGFEKKLLLVGVGYRAQSQGKSLNLTLGFSHPVNFEIPEGVVISTPDQTTIIVSGVSKQLVGQVAANIRAYRSPEPYKGKGVRYADEHVRRKESKKK